MPSNLSPVMEKIYTCLTLSDVPGKKRTRSMVHNDFGEKISHMENAKIDRSMSPFCPLDIEDDSNWITACFVSPMMLIASPLYLCNKDGVLEKKLKVMPVFRQEIQNIPIVSSINIQNNDVCLLTIEEPYWKVGWAGISFINSI